MIKKICILLALVSLAGCTLGDGHMEVTVGDKDISVNPLQDSPAPIADFTTTMTLSPDTIAIEKDKTFTVTVLLSDAKEGITTVSSQVLFDPTFLQVVSLGTTDSAFPLEFRNKIDAKTGTIDVSRSHSKGVTGDNLKIVTITYRALKKGNTAVSLNVDKTIVLLKNDEKASPPVDSFRDMAVDIL